jgi:hypothetical protein
VKKVLANPEPSTHGTFETCQPVRSAVAVRGKTDIEKAAVKKGVSRVLALATLYPPADFLPRSGLVQYIFRDGTITITFADTWQREPNTQFELMGKNPIHRQISYVLGKKI